MDMFLQLVSPKKLFFFVPRTYICYQGHSFPLLHALEPQILSPFLLGVRRGGKKYLPHKVKAIQIRLNSTKIWDKHLQSLVRKVQFYIQK